MEFKEIQELIKLINKSNLTEFELKQGDLKLTIRTKSYFKGKKNIVEVPQVVQVPSPVMPVSHVPAVTPANTTPPPAPAAPNPAPNKAENEEKAEDTSNYLEVKSPMVGTFYRSPSPDKPPFIKVGDNVAQGDVVCIVEAMKLFNEIETEVSGKIVKVVVEDASPVEYDTVLFLVDPNG